MAVVDRYSQPMLRFICENVIDKGRGDKLVLGQVRGGRGEKGGGIAGCEGDG